MYIAGLAISAALAFGQEDWPARLAGMGGIDNVRSYPLDVCGDIQGYTFIDFSKGKSFLDLVYSVGGKICLPAEGFEGACPPEARTVKMPDDLVSPGVELLYIAMHCDDPGNCYTSTNVKLHRDRVIELIEKTIPDCEQRRRAAGNR